MDNGELKMMWKKANIQSQGKIDDGANIEEMIKTNHCKTISKILSDIKLKILLYSLILSVFIGLMIYAFIYLGINFSIGSIIPFTVVGLFLLISTSMEITRLFALMGNADNLPVKESQNYFRKRLNRMKTIDFISYLILLYLMAILVLRGYIQDIGGFKNLSGTNEFQPVILIFILILLVSPWFIRHQNNQRYRKIDSELND